MVIAIWFSAESCSRRGRHVQRRRRASALETAILIKLRSFQFQEDGQSMNKKLWVQQVSLSKMEHFTSLSYLHPRSTSQIAVNQQRYVELMRNMTSRNW